MSFNLKGPITSCDTSVYSDLDYTNPFENAMNYLLLAIDFLVFSYLVYRLYKHFKWVKEYRQRKTHVIIRVSILLVLEMLYQMSIHIYTAIIYSNYISEDDYFKKYHDQISHYIKTYNTLQLILVQSILLIMCFTSSIWQLIFKLLSLHDKIQLKTIQLNRLISYIEDFSILINIYIILFRLEFIRKISQHSQRFRYIQLFQYGCMTVAFISFIIIVIFGEKIDNENVFLYQHLFSAIITFFIMGIFLMCCIFLLQRLERILEDNQFIKYVSLMKRISNIIIIIYFIQKLRISIYILIVSGLIRVVYNILSLCRVTSQMRQFNSSQCRDQDSNFWAIFIVFIELFIDIIPMICISYLFSPTGQPRHIGQLFQTNLCILTEKDEQFRQMQDDHYRKMQDNQ